MKCKYHSTKGNDRTSKQKPVKQFTIFQYLTSFLIKQSYFQTFNYLFFKFYFVWGGNCFIKVRDIDVFFINI